MSKEFKIHRNRDEYLFLRKEIMLRTDWHLNFTKNAVTTSVVFWVGIFTLIYYFSNEKLFDIPISNISTFLLLLPIAILYPLSFKIHENYINFCNIGAYLRKFHEKPIHENDGTFFSWETAHADLLGKLQANKPKAINAMNKSNNELTFLSGISLALFVAFSVLGLNKSFDWYILAIKIITMAIGLYFTMNIHKRSSYRCLEGLAMTAQELWKNYFDEKKDIMLENSGNCNSSNLNP